MKRFLLIVAIPLLSYTSIAQVGINNTEPKASLDITATNASSPTNTDGLLIPRIDTFPSTDPTTAQQGMMVYLTTTSGGNLPGYYYWDNNAGPASWTSVVGQKNTLDQAYDEGGAGNGKVITVDNGELNFTGSSSILKLFSTNNTTDHSSTLNIRSTINSNSKGLYIYLDGTNPTTAPYIGETLAIDNYIRHSASNSITTGLRNRFVLGVNNGGINTGNIGVLNHFYSNINTNGFNIGFENLFDTYSARHIGVENHFRSSSLNTYGVWNHTYGNSINSEIKGIFNDLDNNSNTGKKTYGAYNEISGSSTGDKYGNYININQTANGTHYGVYSDVKKADGYAGYFLGRISFGTGTSNRYLMPTVDGTSGQVLTTDGSGQLSFTTLSTSGGTLDEAYDFGGAGAGKNITADTGAVRINGNDGFLVTGTFGSGNTIDTEITGAGTRMFFNPNKGAFRAGRVLGTQWDNTNIGNYSTAFGNNTIASGQYSTAFGGGNTASGQYSTAFGGGNTASSQYSTAFGNGSTASGESSSAFGDGNTASGPISTAFGGSNTASGQYSTAFGLTTDATGNYSTAFGSGTIASGPVSMAFGQGTSASATEATSFGSGTAASALGATAFGNGTTASGRYSTASGIFTTSPSAFETVIGSFNTLYTPASATTFDVSDRLFTIGNGVDGSNNSNALIIYKDGRMNINDAYTMPIADGSSNQVMTTDGSGTVSWVDPSLGNDVDWYETGGTVPNNINDNIYTNGNVGIGTTTPDYNLSVAGIANLNEGISSGIALRVNGDEALWYNGSAFSWGYGGTANYFQDEVGIGVNSPVYKLDVANSLANGYVAQVSNTNISTTADGLRINLGITSNPTSNNYFIGFYGGTTIRGRVTGNGTGGTNYSTTSDRRLKKNIKNINNSLELINNVKPRIYEFKSAPGIEEYGFIAQELQLIYPQAVSGSPNSDVETDPMMVDYSRLTPLLAAGIKELNEKVKNLESENQQLKETLSKYEALEKRISQLENNSKRYSDIAEN